MTVHVVIVSWNRQEDTLGCLQNLNSVGVPGRVIHVVDNGSVDGSADAIRRLFPEVILHGLDTNRGFAAGANVGIRAALDSGAAFVFLQNNDARVDPHTLNELLAAAERHPEWGLYGPRIYADRARDRLWCCGMSLGWTPNVAALRGFGQSGSGRYEHEEVVDALTGCGLLVSRQVFERVGLLDESWFVYVEDLDFSARAKKAGFSCGYVPTARLEHAGSGSTGGGYSPARKYLTAHGSVAFLRRHGTAGLWASFWIFDVLLWPGLWLVALLSGRSGGVLAKGRGMWDGLLGRPPNRCRLER